MVLPSNLPTEEWNIFRKKVVSLTTGVHHDNNASLLKFTAVLCFLGQSQFQSQKSQKNNSLFVCLCSVDVIERGIELCQYQITCYKFIKILIFWFAMLYIVVSSFMDVKNQVKLINFHFHGLLIFILDFDVAPKCVKKFVLLLVTSKENRHDSPKARQSTKSDRIV